MFTLDKYNKYYSLLNDKENDEAISLARTIIERDLIIEGESNNHKETIAELRDMDENRIADQLVKEYGATF